MKNLCAFFFTIVLFCLSCQEIPPIVGDGPYDPPPPPNDRYVLMEEFTGVGCVQCPAGSIAIEELLALHGDNLIAVSIHAAGNFSVPFPQNQYDFRTTEGSALFNYLGPSGFPTASVNRKKFEGQPSLNLRKKEWAGYILEELSLVPIVALDLNADYDETNRQVQVSVAISPYKLIDNPDVRLSVLFTEDNIVDHQITPESSPDTEADYVHRHVLRGMATPYDGIQLTENLNVGTTVTKSFNYTIPAEWVDKNVKIIAFLSLAGEEKDVLEAREIHLID